MKTVLMPAATDTSFLSAVDLHHSSHAEGARYFSSCFMLKLLLHDRKEIVSYVR